MKHINGRVGRASTTGNATADGTGGGIIDSFQTDYWQRTKNITNFSSAVSAFYDILLVAGGGGSDGGRTNGPGGNGSPGAGAGGVVYLVSVPNSVLTPGSYTIVVGAGGNSGPADGGATKGGDSTFANPGGTLLTALGGGTGFMHSPNAPSQQGGSSGGASASSSPPFGPALQPTQPQNPAYSPFIQGGGGGYGNSSSYSSPSNGAQPGGGGAGGTGSSGPGSPGSGGGGAGGDGIRVPFVIPVSLGTPGPAGSNGYFAGGGGGGFWRAPGSGANGGFGGGGHGAGSPGNPGGTSGGSGTTNTGGGGGGAGFPAAGSGGAGGSGIVAIKYPNVITITAPTGTISADPSSPTFNIARWTSTGPHPVTIS